MRPGRTLVSAVVLAAVTSACGVVSRVDRDPTSSVAAQVDRTHRFEVDLTGDVPTREQVGLSPGDTTQSYTAADNGLTVVYRLAGGRTLTVAASSVIVTTTELAVTVPRSPSAPDELVLPNEVSATQRFTTRDEGRALLQEHADLLGLDPDDIARWYASAPVAAAPDVLLDEQYFSGKARISYVDVGVGVFMADTAYVIWDLSWDPPIPGYAYGTDGVPRPTSS